MKYIIEDNQSFLGYLTFSKTSMASNYDERQDISIIDDIGTKYKNSCDIKILIYWSLDLQMRRYR